MRRAFITCSLAILPPAIFQPGSHVNNLIALSVEDTIHACHMIAVHMVNPLSILRLASPGWSFGRGRSACCVKSGKSLAVAASRTWRTSKQIGCAKHASASLLIFGGVDVVEMLVCAAALRLCRPHALQVTKIVQVRLHSRSRHDFAQRDMPPQQSRTM